ncbi:MAG: hypothetical protein ACTHN2_03515 [Nitrobacter sp.]|jgi:hypothetical protein
MRNLVTSLKKIAFGIALGAAMGLFAAQPAAHAANGFELNFGLFGPGYEGKLPSCESALGEISSKFADKESTYWNSPLQITGYSRIHETAFRPWQSDNIPRRYCTADAMISDGKVRTVHYSIIEDGGLAGFGDGVEFCVVGLDRNWAYNPSCRAARP